MNGQFNGKAHGERYIFVLYSLMKLCDFPLVKHNYSAGLYGFTSWSRCVCTASEWLWVSVQLQDIFSPGKKKERSWERMKHHLVFSKEWRVRQSQLCLRKTLEQVAFLVDVSDREVQTITDKKCLNVIFFPSRLWFAPPPTPCLLLRGVQFYLANPKLVKSKAKNYFQVQWPGHSCLQVVELWFDEFSQQRRGEPFWKTPSVPAVVTFITLYPHVFVPLRISPVEIMKPDLSSRRVSAGFTIITVEQKNQRRFVQQKEEIRKKEWNSAAEIRKQFKPCQPWAVCGS